MNPSSGVDALDDLLDGLFPGDNVVWIGDQPALHSRIEEAFLAAGQGPGVLVRIAEADGLPDIPGIQVIDARPGHPHAEPTMLERAILAAGAAPGARIVIRDLDSLVRRLGADRAFGFFTRTCPRLFDMGALAYWRATRAVSAPVLDAVQRVTQCVLDHTGGRLRVLKAENRPAAAGHIFDIRLEGDGVTLTEVRALGRLAEGLRRLRTARGLTQSEVARMAGVSPSAMSQVESGYRGLNLDTLLTLGEALGVTLDELLDYQPRSGYVLARRDRAVPRKGVVALLDDPTAGLRAFLVTLGAGESGGPATIHKGAELVLVAQGVVQIELNEQAPVLRGGDALLVTHDAIHGWKNLLPEPARLFWIVRD